MKREKALTAAILAAAMILPVAGCMNYEQEAFLNDDFSGRLEMRVTLDPRPAVEASVAKMNASPEMKKAMQESIEKAVYNIDIKEETFQKLFNKDGIKKTRFVQKDKDGVMHFYFTVEFDDIRRAYEGKREIAITEDRGGLITYTEYFQSLKDKDVPAKKPEAESPELYKGYRFRYILHMPRPIVKANTDQIDKNTAVWDMSMEQVGSYKNFFISASIKSENRLLRWFKKFKRGRVKKGG